MFRSAIAAGVLVFVCGALFMFVLSAILHGPSFAAHGVTASLRFVVQTLREALR